jgi:capsular exopolysaccharide synthesis family protein
MPKEGKTVVALNLAITFASTSPRVLVVDADLRGPGLGRLLGLSSLPGIAEVLEGQCRLSDAVRKVTPFGFHCLPAGTASANPVNLLQGARMRELLAQMAGSFDLVFFDSPPLNLFADAHCIASFADAVLLVVRSGWTQREGVQQAVATLEGAYLAGVVLNGASESTDHRYYYHYYNTSKPSKDLKADESPAKENEAAPAHAPSPRESVRA